MNLKLSSAVALSVLLLSGCGQDYEWDTDNKSALEGKYEERNVSQDLTRDQQILAAKSVTQNALFAHAIGTDSVTGVAVSITFGDEETQSFAYGCAELKPEVIASGYLTYESGHTDNCAVVLEPTHRFKLGSLTKTTVGRTILDIDDMETYNFSVDDALVAHLPANILALGDFEGITIRNLLEHSSGLPNNKNVKNTTIENLITETMQLGSKIKPGQMYEYNNLNFVLLGEVIKHVTGSSSWEAEVLQRINASIGEENSFIFPESGLSPDNEWMKTSDTSWMEGKENTLLEGEERIVHAYGFNAAGHYFDEQTKFSTADTAFAAGSALANVIDVTKWMRSITSNDSALLSSGYFDNHIVDMNTYTYQDIYEGHPDWNMGMGIGYDQSQNALFHVGAFPGYNCMSFQSKNENVTLSLCGASNGFSAGSIAYDILNAMYPYRNEFIHTTTTH
jgi:CubicO group peptidase (beta-lactamase class C family)